LESLSLIWYALLSGGGLLADVFLHILPEASALARNQYEQDAPDHTHVGDMMVGAWVIVGLLLFLVLEKVASIALQRDGSPSIRSNEAAG
jgi:hypothetical protein